jgi:hypothetical protein
MRTQLVLAGLLAGVAATVAPLAPASAYCEPEIIVVEGGSGECRNSCIETGERYEAARHKLGEKYGEMVPSYWDIFVCPM